MKLSEPSKIVLAIVFAIVSIFLCQQIVYNSVQNQQSRIDYAEINHVKYGMFSVDEWKKRLVEIVIKEFDRIYESKETEKELREHVGVILSKMIDEVSLKVKKANEKTAGGRFKQIFIDMFVDIEDIKEGVPQYTDAVIKEMKNQKTKDHMKGMVNDQLAEFATKTKAKQDRTRLLRIFEKTDTSNIVTARDQIDQSMTIMRHLIAKQSVVFVLLLLIPFIILVKGKKTPSPLLFSVLTLSLVLLLITGVATPMIDMEAKISQLKFVLIGHTIQFDNQVLYFQSKSILDVFLIMIKHGKILMKFVGVLLLLFSVIFPLLKLLSTIGYYFNFRRIRDSSLINFFVFKSGKWSMTDVMVVAIFMAYIGFNGIIDNQLKIFSTLQTGANVMTTNGTKLQPGYYLFMVYALLAIFLSGYLKRLDAKK